MGKNKKKRKHHHKHAYKKKSAQDTDSECDDDDRYLATEESDVICHYDHRQQHKGHGCDSRQEYDDSIHGGNQIYSDVRNSGLPECPPSHSRYRGRGDGGNGRAQGSFQVSRHFPPQQQVHFNKTFARGRGYGGRESTPHSPEQFANVLQKRTNPCDWYPDDEQYVDDVEVSKEIVRIVRHGRYKWIKMDSEGYVKVFDILRDHKFINACGHISFHRVWGIVQNNDKKRFELKKEGFDWFIKATQGHTVQVENLSLTPITNPHKYPQIFHGTYFEAWEAIQEEGLSRMKRNHIHFAIGFPNDRRVVSGMRKSSELVIVLDLKKAMQAGLKFFASSNNVVLSEGDENGRIHPKFFSQVIMLKPYWKRLQFEVPPDYEPSPRPSKSPKPVSGPSPFWSIAGYNEGKSSGRQVACQKNSNQSRQPGYHTQLPLLPATHSAVQSKPDKRRMGPRHDFPSGPAPKIRKFEPRSSVQGRRY